MLIFQLFTEEAFFQAAIFLGQWISPIDIQASIAVAAMEAPIGISLLSVVF
jgi:hypothetical protein